MAVLERIQGGQISKQCDSNGTWKREKVGKWSVSLFLVLLEPAYLCNPGLPYHVLYFLGRQFPLSKCKHLLSGLFHPLASKILSSPGHQIPEKHPQVYFVFY